MSDLCPRCGKPNYVTGFTMHPEIEGFCTWCNFIKRKEGIKS